MFRMFVVAALVIAVMVAIKDGRILRETGLKGSCTAVAAPKGQEGFWEACRAGKLDGRPNLTRSSCTANGVAADVEYWRCPTRLEAAPGG
jgi:hypothetical protein